jgi:hypothetical protein
MRILILSLLFFNQLAFATEKTWPPQFNMSQVIFAPDLPYQFSDVEGLAAFASTSSGLDHYMLTSPHPPWPAQRSCDLPNRGTGYIQTIENTNEYGDYLAVIGIPVSVDLRTSFLDQQKEQLLRSSLLSVSILNLDLDSFQLKTLAEFRITFRTLCELDPNCSLSLNDTALPVVLNFDKPFLTPSFLFQKGQEIRVRVSWTALGICNEDFFDFKMGDQIRILAAF